MTHKSSFILPFVAFAMALLLNSCGSTEKIIYLQGADTLNLDKSQYLYDARIMPKDLLTITVSATDPEAAKPFNPGKGGYQASSGGGGNQLQYLVDNDGNINFPVVGTLHIAGLTKRESEQMIKSQIAPYLSKTENPIVTVEMSSYKVTVLGEVGSPGTIRVDQEKINILEAIAQAGDLTMYGKRDNVHLIRVDAKGKKEIHTLNLNKADIITSPYYYLQQNDIVYVEQNKTKIDSTAISSVSMWFSVISFLTSMATLVVSIVK
ncbi:MAG: polysaccharide export protein [Prevotella sp.]|nr:polysaccharide export protein [Prevotella sp.]